MEKLFKYKCERCGYILERPDRFDYLESECTYKTDLPVKVKCYPVEKLKAKQK